MEVPEDDLGGLLVHFILHITDVYLCLIYVNRVRLCVFGDKSAGGLLSAN